MSKVKVRVGDVSYINANNFDFKDKESINYLDTGSITNNIIDGYKTLNTNEKIPSRAKRAVNENTIVYSSVRPKLCHFGILHNLPKNAVVSTGFITLDAKPIIEPYYLYNCITTNDKINYISKIADTSVSSYPSINPSDLADMEIEIEDDFIKQKMISDLLINIDKKVENNNKIISELESMAKTIYDYWFLQFEFPNEDGKPYKSSGGKMVWNEELKREIPLNWDVYEILSFCSWESASQPPKSEFIHEKKEGYIRFVQNRDYDSDDNITYIPKKSSTKLCDEYDILIDKYGDKTAGKVRYGIKGAYNVALGKITSSIPHSQEYLRSFLSTNSMFNYLHNACMASTRSSMNETVFKGIFIPVPNEELLVKFEKMMKTIINKKLQMKAENYKLASLRDFLLPLLMNGQVTFKEDE